MNFNSTVGMDGASRLKHPHTTQISTANPPKHHLTRLVSYTHRGTRTHTDTKDQKLLFRACSSATEINSNVKQLYCMFYTL